ncbi:nucleotidyltransferase domain-containing protein, partial [Flavobacterium oreochromis]
MDYKIINEFLAKKFKEATNVLLFGSYTKSVKFSDIDILILTDSNLNFSKEVYTFNKQSFEVFVLSKNNIFEIIENDRANGIYISILKEGKIIKDEDSFLKNLKNLINTKQIYTSPFLKKNYIENKLRQTLCYMESVEDFYEKDFLLGEINSQLIDLRLVELGIIEAKKIKHKYEKIKYYDNEFLKDIINLKNDYLKSAFSYKNYVEN